MKTTYNMYEGFYTKTPDFGDGLTAPSLERTLYLISQNNDESIVSINFLKDDSWVVVTETFRYEIRESGYLIPKSDVPRIGYDESHE